MSFGYEAHATLKVTLYDYNSVASSTRIGACALLVNGRKRGKQTVKSVLRLDLDDDQKSTIVKRPEVTVVYSVEDVRK